VIPAGAPPLTYAGLLLAVELGRPQQIGTTVTIRWGRGVPAWPCLSEATLPSRIEGLSQEWAAFCLHDITLAVIGPEWVAFTVHGHHTQAVRDWLARIVRDNEIGHSVWRRDGRYLIDGIHLVEGWEYRVGGGSYSDNR
jgi:hypothetical protein